jgi:hypothetical protein
LPIAHVDLVVKANVYAVLGDPLISVAAGNAPGRLIDLSSPVALAVSGAQGFFRTYNKPDGYGFGAAILDFFYVSPGLHGDERLVPTGRAFTPVSFNADGSADIGPVTPSDYFHIAGLNWTGTPADASNVVSVTLDYGWIRPFESAGTLSAAVAATAALPKGVRNSVVANLQDGRNRMTGRDFAGASVSFDAAAAKLRSGGAAASLQDDADWLAAHLNWFKTH